MNSLQPSLSLPAAGGTPASHWFARGWATVVAWRERSRGRVQLLDLPERMLKDIGLTHTDVLVETGKHFWQR